MNLVAALPYQQFAVSNLFLFPFPSSLFSCFLSRDSFHFSSSSEFLLCKVTTPIDYLELELGWKIHLLHWSNYHTQFSWFCSFKIKEKIWEYSKLERILKNINFFQVILKRMAIILKKFKNRSKNLPKGIVTNRRESPENVKLASGKMSKRPNKEEEYE